MMQLTNKQLKSHEDAKVCYICEKYFLKKLFKDIGARLSFLTMTFNNNFLTINLVCC